jgi:hypothetical protein
MFGSTPGGTGQFLHSINTLTPSSGQKRMPWGCERVATSVVEPVYQGGGEVLRKWAGISAKRTIREHCVCCHFSSEVTVVDKPASLSLTQDSMLLLLAFLRISLGVGGPEEVLGRHFRGSLTTSEDDSGGY